MARVVLVLFFAVLFSACKMENATVDSKQESRIWPPGTGKLVRFDIEPKADAPVLISSKDVQAQLGSQTMINVGTLSFELGPERQEPLELDQFRVQVFEPGADGRLKLLEESNNQDLADHKLTLENPRFTTPELDFEISQILTPCEKGCVVNIVVDYFNAPAAEKSVLGMSASLKSGSSAESAAVLIALSAGTAEPWPRPDPSTRTAEGGTAPSTPDSIRKREVILGGCAWLTEAEVSAAVGKQMRYHGVVPGSNHCTLKSDSGSGEVFVSVSEDVDIIGMAREMSGETESIQVGDRALWLPNASQLYVESGRMRFSVRTAEMDVPRSDREAAQREAIALASLLMTKAGKK